MMDVISVQLDYNKSATSVDNLKKHLSLYFLGYAFAPLVLLSGDKPSKCVLLMKAQSISALY